MLEYSGLIIGDQDIEFDFANRKPSITWIRVELPNSVQPSAVMDSPDNRDLGLGLVSMSITEADKYKLLPMSGMIYLDSYNYNGEGYLIEGFSIPEANAMWTLGEESTIAFSVEEGTSSIQVSMDLESIINDNQVVSVTANDQLVYSGIISADTDNISFEIELLRDTNCNITISLPNAISPSALGMSDDKRMLSLMIKSIAITAK